MEDDSVAVPGQVQDESCPQVQDSVKGRTSIGLLRHLHSYFTLDHQEDVTLKEFKDWFDWAGNVDLDGKDQAGMTALMIACLWGKKTLVEFFLEKGANPNITNIAGDSALHYACSYRKCNPHTRESIMRDLHNTCSRYCDMDMDILPTRPKEANEKKRQAREEDDTTAEMFKLLLKYNAIIHLNHDGFSPVDYAALQGKEGTVEYIISSDLLSKLDELKAFEILAFALALQNKCSDAYRVLLKAMKKRHSDPVNPISKDSTSELESVLGQKESQTLEELKALQTNNHAIIAEAILTGDRVLPESIKSCHVNERVANYGLGLLFDLNTMQQGFCIFTGFLQYEQKGLVKLGYVLRFLNWSTIQAVSQIGRTEIMKPFLRNVCVTLQSYVHLLKGISSATLHENVTNVVQNLSFILFNVTNGMLGPGLFSWKVLDDLLVPITEMINIIMSRVPELEVSGRSTISVSVSHEVLRLMMGCRPYPSSDSPTLPPWIPCHAFICKYTYYRLKRLLAHLLHVEGALDVDSLGNTMMHTTLAFLEVINRTQFELLVDLVKMLIGHGCPTKTKNNKGQTPESKGQQAFSRRGNHFTMNVQEVWRLFKGYTEVLPLQELAARTILYHRIPYQDKIPPRLKETIIYLIHEEDIFPHCS